MGRPKMKAGEVKDAHIDIRVRPEYKAWFQRFADHLQLDISELIDDMARKRAKKEKFEAPPER